MIRLRTKLTWILWIGLCLLLGAGLVVLFSLPFETTKPLIDHLAADGKADQFSTELVSDGGPWLRAIGAAGLILAALMIIYRAKSQAWIEAALAGLGQGLRRLGQDGRAMIRAYHPDWSGIGLVSLIVVFSALSTLPVLWRPMLHDESYTFMAFARQPLPSALSDYHVPNNHLFHTFWLYLAYHLLGIEPWVIRLPAFLAGLALIPAIYALGKRLFSKPTGLVAAALVAASPEVLQYSVTARGYTLLALLTLLLLLASLYVKNQRNAAAWLVWALIAALGFYTIPVFLYSFGAAVAWLGLSWLIHDFQNYRGRVDFLLHLVAAGITAGLTTFLLYLPVVLHHRTFSVLFGNIFIEKLDWGVFLNVTPIRLAETWQAWMNGIPMPIAAALVICFFVALGLHWKLSGPKVPFPLAMVAWLVPLALIQRVYLWSKTWFAFNSLALLWCAAGLVGMMQLILGCLTPSKIRAGNPPAARTKIRGFIFSGLIAVVVIATLGGSLVYKQVYFWDSSAQGTNETIALYLKQNLQEGDKVVISWEDEPMIWYYLLLHQVPEKLFLTRPITFRRAYVVVGPAYNLTLPEVIADKGAEPKNFDLDKAVEVQTVGASHVYLIPGK